MAAGTKIIKPTHRSVKAYYETLKGYAGQAVSHETAVRSAFQTLLAEAAKLRHWTLAPLLLFWHPRSAVVGLMNRDYLLVEARGAGQVSES